jgi:hypothetical protein
LFQISYLAASANLTEVDLDNAQTTSNQRGFHFNKAELFSDLRKLRRGLHKFLADLRKLHRETLKVDADQDKLVKAFHALQDLASEGLA